MLQQHRNRIVFASTALMVMTCASSLRADKGSFYVEDDLVSDIKGAARTDMRVVNPWGLDASPTGPWWVNLNGKGLSIVLDSTGAPAPANNPIVVTIPPAGSGTPTGIVFNIFNGSGDFAIPGGAALFLFASEDGSISAWNGAAGTQAVVKVPASANAVYKGLTLGQTSTSRKLLYAANFHAGTVDIFDTNFATVNPATLSANAFHDSLIPPGYAPFNVQNINGSIYVTYAQQDSAQHDDVAGAGHGYVTQFTPDGTIVKRLQHGNWMNSPWGVALAPADFGDLSGMLLVGQFGSGQIAAFDPQSGNFSSMMLSHGNHPVTIDGLWGIHFGNGALAGPTNVLFFAAGLDDEAHGLFGTLRAKHEQDAQDDQGDNKDQGENNNKHGHSKH